MNNHAKTGYPSIDKPWLKYYLDEAINAPLPACSVYEYLWDNNKAHLEEIALNYFDNRITYKELFTNIEKVAKGFYSIGVRKGDIVTIFSVNTPETIYCLYALNLLGAVSNMEYVTESANEAISAIERCKSHTVIILDILLSKFASIVDSATVKNIVSLPVSASMPFLKRTLLNLKAKGSTKKRKACYKEVSFQSLLQVDQQFARYVYNKNDPAVIVHSGGTTGVPKGVVLTNDNLNYIAWAFKHHQNDTKRKDTWLCAIPAFHAFGLAMGIVFPLSQGMELILVVKYTDQEIVRLFIKHKPNHIMGSGAHIPSIQENDKIMKMNLSFFKTCGLGGTPLTTEKEKELVEFLKQRNSIAKASIGYGMSETCSAIATELNRYYGKVGSSGIVLLKSNVKVLDIDSSRELKYGEIGELCFSGPGVMSEYYKNESETAQAFFIDDNNNKWVHSGDLGYVDEDGFVFITGRIKRIYSTRAEKNGTLYKLFPDYVAKVILQLPYVKECAVVCIDDDCYKSIAIAFVVLSGFAKAATIENVILNHVLEVLPVYSVPKKICCIDQIPLTPVGKIDYCLLEGLAKEMLKKDTY